MPLVPARADVLRLCRQMALGASLALAGVSGASTPPPTAASAPPEEQAPALRPRVGFDDAPGKRERLATAVLLHGFASGSDLKLQPLVCVIRGAPHTGVDCGLAMPPSARVRLTQIGGSGLPRAVVVKRSTRDAHVDAEEGPKVYKAPTAPACCNYAACDGLTVPYSARLAALTDPTEVYEVLAVWPENAELGLKPQPASPGRPSSKQPQVVQVGASSLRAGRALLEQNDGTGWKPLSLHQVGPHGYEVLATAAVDPTHELAIVYADWANDYGLYVVGGPGLAPLYGFSCGNI